MVAWNEQQLALLPEVLAANHEAGDTESRMLTAQELIDLEPALAEANSAADSPSALTVEHGSRSSKQVPLGAVLVPREVISEPWMIPVAYAESARANGCAIHTNAEVAGLTVLRESDAAAIRRFVERKQQQQVGNDNDDDDHVVGGTTATADSDADEWYWVLTTRQEEEKQQQEQQHPRFVGARVVINCAGLGGDYVEALRREAATYAAYKNVLSEQDATLVALAGWDNHETRSYQHRHWSIRPHKGEFVVFDPPTDWQSPALQHIIEPVPTLKTKGVIVWSTLYGQVGGCVRACKTHALLLLDLATAMSRRCLHLRYR